MRELAQNWKILPKNAIYQTKFIFQAHEYALYPIDFFRLAIRNFKKRTDYTGGVIMLNFDCYPVEVMKLFLDVLYGVNFRKVVLEELVVTDR
jgi:hypothetical protein